MDNLQNTTDMRLWYIAMNECSAYLKAMPTRKEPSPNTVKQYESAFKRMSKNKQDPISLAKTKNSYYHYRAAWCYICEREAKQYLKAAEKERDHEKKIKLIKSVIRLVNAIKKIPPDFSGSHLKQSENGEYVSQWVQAKKPAQKSHSKKHQKLPKDWQNRYFEYILKNESQYALHVALCSISGCRPAELESGILLEDAEKGIKITIESKKTHNGKFGQDVRSCIVWSDSKEFFLLKEHLKHHKSTVLKINSAKNFGELLRHYSKQVFPRSSYVSPYTYRHEFARRAKCLLSEENASIVMGHSNSKSTNHYSNAAKSSGGLSIYDVQGTKKVKLVNRRNLDFSSSPTLRM